MGKNPSVAILAMGLAFCAFCHFFVTCNADDASDLRKGIESLSNVMGKYRAELDNKVKFVKLQEAIDAIDNAMQDYQGKAKDKLPQVLSVNSDAKITYENCVAPVFKWCISANSTFDLFIPFINASNLSPDNKDVIWNKTVGILNNGLEKILKSTELLKNVQYKTAVLKNLFHSILHDVNYDFSPDGFYGRLKISLEREEAIENFFTLLTKKIEEATEIVKDIDVALEQDHVNLRKLHQVTEDANIHKNLLLSDAAFLRALFIPDIKNLKDECTNYVNWHG
ncbi:hypothetical protein KR067_012088 [Drosophila pandora]|nr:hypothetical protein KR067_012088 [Drosophila pandora]